MGGLFDIPEKEEELNKLKLETEKSNFWDNVSEANEVFAKFKRLEKEICNYNDLKDNIMIMLELPEEVNEDMISEIEAKIEELEVNTLLSGKYDRGNCYLEIHPGAGGTESCDWASMLKRMYERFFNKYNFKYKIIDEQAGDEAGLKSVTMFIEGEYAYGYLKNEKGVHRLVRISPFDSNKRRHTSFASVSVTPEFKNDIEINIREEDLKIDVYHSSGAGGQSVNTSNSAVRITHLPTKTVVTCQVERSQLRNKEVAMELLKNKLLEQEILKNEETKKELIGDLDNINFGSQIRSYILEPYKLVKDHRTNYESNEPDKVLDGDIMGFIDSVLKNK